MNLSIDSNIFNWLVSLGVLKNSHAIKSPNYNNGKIDLDLNISQMFATGNIFSKIIEKIYKAQSNSNKYDHTVISNIDSLKNAQTPASKLYNWNIICEALKKLGILVDQDLKGLIVAGDIDLINEVLKQIYKFYGNNTLSGSMLASDSTSRFPTDDSISLTKSIEFPSLYIGNNISKLKTLQSSPSLSKETSNMSSPRMGYSIDNGNQKKLKSIENKGDMTIIDLNKVDLNKDLNNASNVLEFFLIVVSKNLNLTPKQAASLLSNGNKYLAHVIVKGIKGQFQPIILLYQNIYTHINHLLNLIKNDITLNGLHFAQSATKPGFLSRNLDISEWTCTLFSRFGFEFANQNLQQHAWEWFISENGGLYACILCLKRHFELVENITSVLTQYGRYNMTELFTNNIKNTCASTKEHLSILQELQKPLIETRKDELLISGIIDGWIDYGLKAIENDPQAPSDTVIIALSFLCNIWLVYPNKIEEQEGTSMIIIGSLKKMIREKNFGISCTSIALLFKLLDTFAANKNAFAPVIYKTLAFSLIENFTNEQLREFILKNMKQIFETNDQIPMSIVLEPLTKQLQVSDNLLLSLNIFDFEFLLIAANNDKLNVKLAVQLIDVLAKIYLNNIAFARLAMIGIMALITRHTNDEYMQEFLLKFIKIGLAMLFTSEKTRQNLQENISKSSYTKSKSVSNNNNNNNGLINQDMEKEVIAAQKRALIIEIIKNIIKINNEIINPKIKPIILYTHFQIKQLLKRENKGIIMLISLFGDPNAIIQDFEKNMQAKTGFVKVNPAPGSTSQSDINNNNKNLKKINDSTSSLEPKREERVDLDPLIQLEDENFGKNAGIGLKKKAKKESKSHSELSPIDSKKNQPDARILEELNNLKKRNDDKVQREREYEEYQREKQEITKKKLRNQLEKRNIEHGIGSQNKTDIVSQGIIFDFNSHEVDKILEKKQNYLSDIALIDLDIEEDIDKEGVWILMKRYHKAIKTIFKQYANTAYVINPINGIKDVPFHQKQDKYGNIHLVEIYKMINDYDCKKLITKDEINALVRLINTKIMNKPEVQALDFDAFNHFFIQLALFIYSKPPKNLAHMPIYVQVQELFNHFREITQKQGKSTILYDDPDSTETGDKDLYKFLAGKLRKNTDYELPDNYKKITEKSFNMDYAMPNSIGNIDEKYLVCYQILDDVLAKKFGIHLFEPITIFTSVTKPKLKNPTIDKPLQNNYINQLEPKIDNALDSNNSPDKQSIKSPIKPRAKSSSTDPIKPEKRRVLQISNKLILSKTLKAEVAKTDYKTRPLYQEVAEVLQEMIEAVEDGKTSLPKRLQGNIVNKALEAQMKLREQFEIKKEEFEKRRKLRAQIAKQELEAMKEKENARDLKKKEVETKRLAEEALAKKKEEKRKMLADKLKKELDMVKEKKKEEEDAKKKEELAKQEEQKLERKKAFEKFNSERKKKYKEESEGLKAQRDKEEQERKLKEDKEKDQENERRKNIQLNLEKEKKKVEQDRKNNDAIKALIKSSIMQSLLKQYEKPLITLFLYYVDLCQHQLEARSVELLQYKGWMYFCSQFSIFPSILELLQVQLIYRSLTKNKQREDGQLPIGMIYDDFIEALVRISIKSRDICDKIYAKAHNKTPKSGHFAEKLSKAEFQNDMQKDSNTSNLTQTKQETNFDENKIDKEKEDNYNKIDETKVSTIEGLFIYLDLPQDKQALLNKLHSLSMNSQYIPPKQKREAWKEKLKKLEGLNQNEPKETKPRKIKIVMKKLSELSEQKKLDEAKQGELKQDEANQKPKENKIS